MHVADITAPVISVTNASITLEAGTAFTEADALTGVSATDNVDGNVNVSADITAVQNTVPGDYTVTYTAVDSSNNEANATATVHVVDTTMPSITVSNTDITIEAGTSFADSDALTGVSATDIVDGNLTVNVDISAVQNTVPGDYTVTYTATDSANNQATATATVHVVDTTPPSITVTNSTINVETGTAFTETDALVGVSATDIVSGTVVVSADISAVNTAANGDYTVTYSATDDANNTATATATVHVGSLVLTANSDNVQPADLSMQTLHVTANDYVPNGSTITNVYLKVWDPQVGGYVYIPSFSQEQGNWTVIGSDVEFTPNSTFGGGVVSIEYQIVDDSNNTSESWITIEYPEVLKANNDTNSTPTTLDPYSVDVLANDIFSEITNVSIGLMAYDSNGQPIAVSTLQAGEGEWSVVNGMVIFTPNADFGGGTVSVNYVIEENGMRSMAWASIDYPVFVRAEYDRIDMNDTTLSVTYNVMQNDVNSSAAEVYLLTYDSNGSMQQVKSFSGYNGEWMVESNQSITFIPGIDFSGGMVHVDYVLTDGTYTSQAGLDIQYPTYLQANYDRVESVTDLVPVNIDVLNNDTLPGDYSSVTLLVQGPWDDQLQQVTYTTRYEDNSGVWQVESNQTITFTPSSTFGGGSVWWSYKIMDGNGHESEAGIEVVYPLFVSAQYDEYSVSQIESSVTYDVLGNDGIGDGLTASVLFVDFNNGGSYTTTLTDWSGEWTVGGNEQVVFTPNADFGGGDVHVEYVITDNNGHYSQAGFTIHFPVGPTPVCSVTQLTTLTEVYDALTGGLSFTLENGYRGFNAEIDQDAYVIDPNLYTTSTALNGLNPMYMVRYEERTWMTQSNDTFVSVEMSATEVGLDSTNYAWYYNEDQNGNDRGYKYLVSESDGGSYSVETDGSNTLSIGGTPVFSFKIVRDISTSEIDTVLTNAGVLLTLDSNDTAQMHLSKELMSSYNWWGAADTNTYTDLGAFITAKSYDSSATYFDWGRAVFYGPSGAKTVLFAAGSSGTNGTLVEVNTQDNAILTSNAGTWEIRTVTDDQGQSYEILDVDIILCGYNDRIFKHDAGNSTVIEGEIDTEANIISAELSFSASLKDKLQQFFITNESLNIDPQSPVNPEITDVMLDGKIFYTAEQDINTGMTYYKRLTANVGVQQIVKENYTVNDNTGEVVSSLSKTLDYMIDKGRIRIYGAGDVQIGLNEIDSTSGDWNVTIYTRDGIYNELWMSTEPAGFPTQP